MYIEFAISKVTVHVNMNEHTKSYIYSHCFYVCPLSVNGLQNHCYIGLELHYVSIAALRLLKYDQLITLPPTSYHTVMFCYLSRLVVIPPTPHWRLLWLQIRKISIWMSFMYMSIQLPIFISNDRLHVVSSVIRLIKKVNTDFNQLVFLFDRRYIDFVHLNPPQTCRGSYYDVQPILNLASSLWLLIVFESELTGHMF